VARKYIPIIMSSQQATLSRDEGKGRARDLNPCQYMHHRTERPGLRGKGKNHLQVLQHYKFYRHPFFCPCSQMSAWDLENLVLSMLPTHKTSTPLTRLYWTNIPTQVTIQTNQNQRLKMTIKLRAALHITYDFLT
jgi:hypothetical protein